MTWEISLAIVGALGWGGWVMCLLDLRRVIVQRDLLVKMLAKSVVDGALTEIREYAIKLPEGEFCGCDACSLRRAVAEKAKN
jgi:hypothetical protein